MRVAIPCGSCGRPLRLEQALLGRIVRCPLCFATFEAVAEQATPVPEEPPGPAPVASPPPPKRLFEPEPEHAEARSLANVALVPEPVAPARRQAAAPMVRFSAALSKDPDRTLKGLWQAEADEDGLRLHRDRDTDIRVPVGHGNARFLGGNQLTISTQGREVVLTLLLKGTDQARLAHDLADYLNNERGPLDPNAYAVSRKLNLLALLPLGVPLVALAAGLRSQTAIGKLAWCALGVSLAGLCLWMLQRGAWTVRQRVQYGGLAGGLSYGTLLVGLLLTRLFPYAVDPARWHSFSPSGGGYRVQLPGKDQIAVRFYGWWGHFNVVESRSTGMDFAVGLLDPMRAEDLSLPPGAFYEHCKADYLARNVGSRSTHAGLRFGELPPGYDFVGRYRDSAHGEGVFVARLVRVGDLVYLVAVAGSRASEDHPDVKRFLDSFVPDPGHLAQSEAPGWGADKPIPGPEDLQGLKLHFTFDESEDQLEKKGGRFFRGAQPDAEGVRGKALQTHGGAFGFAREDLDDVPDRNPFTVVGWLQTFDKRGRVLMVSTLDKLHTGTLVLNLDDGQLSAEIRPNRFGIENLELSGLRVSDGRWHHFALRRLDVDHFDLYIDGMARDAGQLQSQEPFSFRQGGLGTPLNLLDFRDVPPLEAAFDDFALFNRALTPAEIARLAQRP
jgi:hypothetical protein